MGIPALWDVIKDQDRSVPIAQLAEDHYRKHGRPLRIAVDEADWRFNNLTPQQVYHIRESSNQPAYQGIEKSMFYRICRLLAMNIQLLFVFDGPKRPWKRGKRGSGKIDFEQRRLLQEMLGYLRVPRHDAPGEAEAECARLQMLGVVDAVFSQDSDTLMFGCTVLLRDDRVAKQKGGDSRAKENTQKSGKSMRIVNASEIQEAYGFDRDGLVLFAMLVGADYDVKGLDRCGPALALKAVKAGLGRSLCRCRTKTDCVAWRDQLLMWLQTQRSYHKDVPFDYPDIRTLDKYNRPNVSADEDLLDLRGLREGWDRPLKELELLELTSSRFNIWGRLYMNWIAPVLLTQSIGQSHQSLSLPGVHEIKLVKQRFKKLEDGTTPRPLERKLTFSPFGISTLTRTDFEGGDRRGYWTGVASDSFDPSHRVEWEFPTFLVEKMVAPEDLDLSAPEPKGKKKRQEAGDETPTSSAPKRQRKSRAEQASQPSPTTTAQSTPVTRPASSLVSESATKRTYTKSSLKAKVMSLNLADSDEELEEVVLPSSQGKHTVAQQKKPHTPTPAHMSSVRQTQSIIIDLDSASEDPSDDDDDDESEKIRQAIALSMSMTHAEPAQASGNRSATSFHSETTPLRKTVRDPADLAALRALRLRHFESRETMTQSPLSIDAGGGVTPPVKSASLECIDLTDD